ncbi:hypothetical protein OGAPHI_006965 [Ogataea philodendri]|uniref:Uncharacterized protein n=1 Tax=Ogataea philodendri TaxID=1378263 RepID=A0A9P8SZS1_9ASCO|nr:uncharacterized protein OGAPHI_006965 [Ogataea philodendri]KAH3660379.1 hypothetical protein OGAPHI_006965 [Ogataea philodendri]
MSPRENLPWSYHLKNGSNTQHMRANPQNCTTMVQYGLSITEDETLLQSNEMFMNPSPPSPEPQKFTTWLFGAICLHQSFGPHKLRIIQDEVPCYSSKRVASPNNAVHKRQSHHWIDLSVVKHFCQRQTGSSLVSRGTRSGGQGHQNRLLDRPGPRIQIKAKPANTNHLVWKNLGQPLSSRITQKLYKQNAVRSAGRSIRIHGINKGPRNHKQEAEQEIPKCQVMNLLIGPGVQLQDLLNRLGDLPEIVYGIALNAPVTITLSWSSKEFCSSDQYNQWIISSFVNSSTRSYLFWNFSYRSSTWSASSGTIFLSPGVLVADGKTYLASICDLDTPAGNDEKPTS